MLENKEIPYVHCAKPRIPTHTARKTKLVTTAAMAVVLELNSAIHVFGAVQKW